MPAQQLLFKSEVIERTGTGFSTIWNWMRKGEFPRARQVGGKVAWYESEIEQWINSRPIKQYKPLDAPKRKRQSA